MGRQSARMWFDEYDHKDIYFDGHYHKQMYLSDESKNLTLLWEKLAEVVGFQFTLRTSNSGTFQVKGNITIDWGNGTVKEYSYSELTLIIPPYDTSESGVKTVTISGNLFDISFKNTYGLIQVLTPFPETMSAKENFSYCFYQCEDLISVPEDLFINCPNAINFGLAFYYVHDLEVPENLFSTCFNAENFVGCFNGLYTSIPENLFKNCINATNFQGCFRNSRIGTFPDNLFAYNTKATSFKECFYNSRITKIPSNMFGDNENLETVENCFGYCSNLITVREDVFDGCPNIINFNSAFYNCQGITSAVPELWNRTNVTDSENCFYYCINAENYSDIPSEWR